MLCLWRMLVQFWFFTTENETTASPTLARGELLKKREEKRALETMTEPRKVSTEATLSRDHLCHWL